MWPIRTVLFRPGRAAPPEGLALPWRWIRGDDGWSDVTTLGQVLAVGAGRPADADITLFKPMGMGLSDLSVAILVYQRAVELGLGMALPARNVPMPRWTLA
mgnify:CR=1 FL=1